MTDDDIAKALADARRDETPPAEMEDRILAALKTAGLVRPPHRPMRTRLLVATAIAASLLAGVWIGVEYRRPSPGQSAFLLLLYEDAAFDARHRTEFPRLEAEYTAWLRGLERSGHAVMGEKLAWGGADLSPNQPAMLLPDTPSDSTAHGFFIILADDESSAIRVAETCPHLKYGGRIVVRPIAR
jgi:hypothetical protein